MGFRRFPGESLKKQREGLKACCTHKSMQEWDCGCSWGCDLCWVSYRCKKCGAVISQKMYSVLNTIPLNQRGIIKNIYRIVVDGNIIEESDDARGNTRNIKNRYAFVRKKNISLNEWLDEWMPYIPGNGCKNHHPGSIGKPNRWRCKSCNRRISKKNYGILLPLETNSK